MASALKANPMMGSARSAFAGKNLAFKSVVMTAKPVKPTVTVEANGRRCELTGTKRNKANAVCFSNKKSRKWQYPNLQTKKIYWAAGQRWVSLKISTRAIKTLERNGIDAMAAEAGIDLWKLPFEDARPERLQYLEENKGKVPVAKNDRAMKNPEKLAASKKQPKYPVYEQGGKIVWIRPGMEEKIFGVKEQTQEQPAELKVTVSQ